MKDIVVSKLCKAYGDNKVLNNFDLNISECTITCVMGPSGCGKTTLLNILLGLETADSGEIKNLPQSISAVFQEDRLFEDFSAVSNIKAVNTDKAKATTLIEAMGLAGSEKKPVKELSGGMKRRVAIARALAYEADFVVMDEPFKGLDEKTKGSVIDFVKKALKNKTALIVTHDREEAKRLGAVLVTMNAYGECED